MKTHARNTLFFALGDTGTRLIGFLVTVYLARVLGPSAFGVVSLGLAVLGYLAQLSGSGIQLLEARNTAAEQEVDPQRVSSVVSVRLVLGAAIILIATAISFLFVDSGETRDIVLLYALTLVPLALYIDWFFQGKERFEILSVSKLVNSLISAVVVWILIKGPDDLRFAPLALLIGMFAAACILIISYKRRYGSIRFEINPSSWADMFGRSLPVGFGMFVGQNAVNLGPILVGWLFTSADVGMYSAGIKLIILLLLLDRAVNSMYLPIVSRVRAARPEDLDRIVSVVLKVVVVIVIPLAICCFVAADDIVGFLFGPGYEDAVTFLRILLGYFVLTIPNSVFMCTLVGSGKELHYTRILITGSLLLAALVFVCAITIGPAGAAVGVVLGEFSMFVMLFSATKKVVLLRFLGLTAKPLVASVVMAVTAFAAQDWNTVAVLLLCLTMFIATLLAMGGLGRDDVQFLRERLV